MNKYKYSNKVLLVYLKKLLFAKWIICDYKYNYSNKVVLVYLINNLLQIAKWIISDDKSIHLT